MNKHSRRLAAIVGAILAATPVLADDIKVTLLGTGSPVPNPARFSQSTLIEAGSEKILIDFGRGGTIRLNQLGIPLGQITAGFITHMHSDHVIGLPDMWLSGWIGTRFGSRKAPMVVYGPKGTEAMTANLTEAFSEDIRIRKDDEKLPPEGIVIDAHDIEPGKVYERNGLTVTAFEVNHGELIKPAFGYKIDYDGKTVVISGDTKYDENVANAAKGADLLIHEVAWAAPELIAEFPVYNEILAHHTTPEEAGRIFSMAQPKLAVYAHIVASGVPGASQPDILDMMMESTRTTYDGPLLMGEDLMAFVIGDDGVSVTDPEGEPLMVETVGAAN